MSPELLREAKRRTQEALIALQRVEWLIEEGRSPNDIEMQKVRTNLAYALRHFNTAFANGSTSRVDPVEELLRTAIRARGLAEAIPPVNAGMDRPCDSEPSNGDAA